MSDPLNTPGNPGSTPGGDKGRAPTGGGNPSGTDAPSSGGYTLQDIQRAVTEATAPILERVNALENQQGARRRVSTKKSDGTSPADQDAGDGASDDFESMSKADLARIVAQQGRELASLKQGEAERAQREARDQVTNALTTEISKGKYANADLLERLVAPNLRIGSAGDVIHDDGKKVTPLAEIVREIGSRDVFQLPSKGGGSGAGDEGQPVNGIPFGQKTLEGEDIDALSDDDFAKLTSNVLRSKNTYTD